MTKTFDIVRVKEIMRITDDDWYPCFPGHQVRIKVTGLTNGTWRVCVWGADDCGMEIDVNTRMQALDIFQALPTVITKKDLKKRGFVPA